MKTRKYRHETSRSIAGLCIAIAVLVSHENAVAQATVDLGTAEAFAVLAAPSISSTSGGTINGDLGVSPGNTFIPGADPVTVNGVIHLADAVSLLAQNHLVTAYNDAASRPLTALIPAGQLAGLTLLPGVYKDDGAPVSLGISVGGTLTLDADGDPDAVWIFQSGSSLIAESGSRVVLINGADACNVFWQVGSSATLRTDVTFVGTILAMEAITLETRAVLLGRALARTAAITLDNNTITAVICEVQVNDVAGYTIEKTRIDTNGSPVGIGDVMSFGITVVNTGNVDLVTVNLTDTYDTNQLQYISTIPPSIDHVNDGAINWANVGPLSVGSSTQIVANFTVVCTGNSPFGTNTVTALAGAHTNVAPDISEEANATYEIENGFIGDTVWVDVDGNGIPDEDLAIHGINGVTVRLYELVGGTTNLLASTVTDTANGLLGQYLFDAPTSVGLYIVVVDQTTVPSTYPINTTPLSVMAEWTDCGSDFTADFGFMPGAPTAIGWGDSRTAVNEDQRLDSQTTPMNQSHTRFNSNRRKLPEGLRTWAIAGMIRGTRNSPDGIRRQIIAELIRGIGTGSGRFSTHRTTAASAVETVGEQVSTVDTVGSTDLESPGLYIITAETFRRSGMNPASVDPKRLRVYVDSSEVAVYVTTEQSIWAEWDSMVFYVDEGQSVSLGYDQNGDDPLRMTFRFVFLEPGDDDVVIVRVADAATGIHVALSSEQVRYLITGFEDTIVWLLDVTDVELPSLLLGAEIIQIDNETGLYFSKPDVKSGTVYAVGESAIIEIDSINP